jgi:hypothetical protein
METADGSKSGQTHVVVVVVVVVIVSGTKNKCRRGTEENKLKNKRK